MFYHYTEGRMTELNYTLYAFHSFKTSAFSKGFYEALGNGEIISKAFEFGQNRIQLEIYGQSDRSRKLILIFSEAENR